MCEFVCIALTVLAKNSGSLESKTCCTSSFSAIPAENLQKGHKWWQAILQKFRNPCRKIGQNIGCYSLPLFGELLRVMVTMAETARSRRHSSLMRALPSKCASQSSSEVGLQKTGRAETVPHACSEHSQQVMPTSIAQTRQDRRAI